MRPKHLVTAESWWAAGYLLSGLALAPLYWLPAAGALAGLLLLPLLLLGLPVLVAAMRAAGRVAALSDRRLSRELGVPPADAGPPPSPRELLRGRRGWQDLAFSLLVAAWSSGAGLVLLGAFSVGAALAVLPVLIPVLGADSATFGGVPANPLTMIVGTLLGLVLITAALAGARPLVRLEARLMARVRDPADARRLLQQRITTLEATRTLMVDAAEAERRRIERDLHDGAQQRLLAVTMAISRAHKQLARDPDKAERLLTEAHGDARAAIDELRSIARSAHPPVLTERGLPPAVTSMAQRCPVPVRLDIGFEDRPARRAEAVAYYVLAELLTNTAKHAAASKVSVQLWRDADRLKLRVTDDGNGGAVETEGGGLAGLRARLEAVDGAFSVTSPPGGATLVEAELPWNA
ncbi:histidine kinase [Actinomadura welshii]